MALRRLLSGWLIAMAALARSVAQALERASEDRSATPDPVMAVLAERYPGAPAHWLAHVAERTSLLAEAGEAPLSLNSDAAAWPDGLAPLSATAVEPEPAPPDAPRPAPRRDADVPTLAALRDRSSEVWLRPEVERPRRPRPVFAAVPAAPASERARSATPGPAATPRRPRSPLTFVGAPSPALQNASESSTSESSAPVSDASAAKASRHEAAWPEPPPSSATPDTTKARLEGQGTAETRRVDFTSRSARPTDSVEDRPETLSERLGRPPAVHRHRSWFFAESASGRLGRSLDLSMDPGRRPGNDGLDAETAAAIDPSPAPRAAVSLSTSNPQAAAPDRSWRAVTPPRSRRSILGALAALRPKSHSEGDRPQASEPVMSATPTIDWPSPRSRREHPARTVIPPLGKPSTRTAPAFSPIQRDAPPPLGQSHEPRRIVHRAARRASNPQSSIGETGDRDKRSTFTAFPRTASRPASRGFAVSPPDGRWPALPPTTLASPHGVEASPPRWDVLAREQEEGRWSV